MAVPESPLGVQEVSTTSGLGPYALGGPTPNHWRFADKIANNSLVTYEATDGARSEYGLGRFQYPATLHRQNIINSSAGGSSPVDWPTSGQCVISLVQEPGSGIPPGGDCAQALIKYSSVDYEASWQWRPYPIAVWIDGAAGANRRIRLAITEPVLFYQNFNGSYAYCGTAPTAYLEIAINRISPVVYTGPFTVPDEYSHPMGFIRFYGAYKYGEWVSTGPMQLQPGDRIEFLFPADTFTIANISFTARGIIICEAAPAPPPEPLPEEPEEFTVGAIYLDTTYSIWHFPPMTDSPLGSLSYWMYVDNFIDASYDPPDGDLHQNNSQYVIFSGSGYEGGSGEDPVFMFSSANRGTGSSTAWSPQVSVSNITSANPAVVTFTNPHGIVVDSYVNPTFFAQSGWSALDNTWYKVLAVTSTTMTIAMNATGTPAYNPSAMGGVSFKIGNATGVFLADENGDNWFVTELHRALPPRTWVHVMWSWDTNHTAGSKVLLCYHNDVAISVNQRADIDPAFAVSYSNFDNFDETFPSVWCIGGGVDYDSGGVNCYLAEFWFAPGQFIDWTDPDERAKFRDPDTGKPVFLGDDGSVPTGTAPVLYQHISQTPSDPYTHLDLPLRFMTMRYGDVISPGTLENDITSSSVLVFSIWLWGDADLEFSGNGDNNIYISIYGGYAYVSLYDVGGSDSFEFHFNYPPGGTKNIRFAVDTDHAIGSKIVHAHVNNAEVSVVVDTDTADNLVIKCTDPEGFLFYDSGFISEVWLAPDQFFDLTDAFIDGLGNPVDLGANGELVSGTAPSFYYTVKGTEPATDIAINRGTGGDVVTVDDPELFSLVPDAARFLKNNTSGDHLHLTTYYEEFTMAPSSPWDDAVTAVRFRDPRRPVSSQRRLDRIQARREKRRRPAKELP